MGEETSESYQGMGQPRPVRYDDEGTLKPRPVEALPESPVDDCLRRLDKDAARLTAIIDQLDLRLAPIMGEGVPYPSDDCEPAPGTSALVSALMVTHARLDGELSRLDRMMRRLEVG